MINHLISSTIRILYSEYSVFELPLFTVELPTLPGRTALLGLRLLFNGDDEGHVGQAEPD